MNKYELVDKTTGRIVLPGELIVNPELGRCVYIGCLYLNRIYAAPDRGQRYQMTADFAIASFPDYQIVEVPDE